MLALIRYRALLVIGPLVLVLVAAAVPSTVHRFSDLTSGRTHYGPGNSLRARLDLWRTNLPKVEHNPVLGNGFKSIVEDTTATKGGGVNVVAGGALPQRLRARRGGAGRARARVLLLAAVRHVGGVPPQLPARPQGPRPRARGRVHWGRWWRPPRTSLMSADSNLMTQVAVSGTFWTLAAIGHAAGRVDLAE